MSVTEYFQLISALFELISARYEDELSAALHDIEHGALAVTFYLPVGNAFTTLLFLALLAPTSINK